MGNNSRLCEGKGLEALNLKYRTNEYSRTNIE